MSAHPSQRVVELLALAVALFAALKQLPPWPTKPNNRRTVR